MKNFIYNILLLSFLFSCSKYPDPSTELTYSYQYSKSGSNQKAFAGDFLKDSITLRVTGQNVLIKGMQVDFSVLSGGGELTKPSTILDESGFAYTHWKLGNTSNKQIVKASIYNLDGSLLKETEFTSTGFNVNNWNMVENQPDISMWDVVADTVNNITYMISGTQLYRQSGTYFNWVLQNTINTGGFVSFEIDSRNYLYVCNSAGDIYKSSDNGNSWNKCTKPYPAYSYIDLFVSNNNYLWVSRTYKKLLCSRDDGKTWKDASAGLSDSDGVGEIFKHPDGTLFFRTTNYRLFKSDDDGNTWTRITSVERADELFMTANGDLLVYSFYMKHSINKSSDKGANFTELYSTTSNSWTSKLNFFNYYKGTYYFLIPGKGILKSTNLINFEEYWNKSDLFNLFVDHNGVLMARDLSNHLYYKAIL